jgi:hypothetical protein
MPVKLSRNIAAVFFVITLLIGSVIGQGFWAGMVICANEKGTTIELGLNGTCFDDIAKTGGVSSCGEISSSGSCGRLCADMPVFQYRANMKTSSEDIPDFKLFLSMPFFQEKFTAFSIPFTSFTPLTTFLNPTIANLLTVLLLI